MSAMSNLAIHRREQMESPHPARQLLAPRLALIASDLRTPPLHGTTAVFTVDRESSGKLTFASLVGLLAALDADGEVRLAIKRDGGQVRGIIIGVRPRASESLVELIREADGDDADDAHAAAVEYAPC